MHVLHSLSQSRPADLKITVIAPHPRLLYSGMVPGFVAGHYTLDECLIPLEGLLTRCGARYIPGRCVAMDADSKTIALANGETVG